MTDVLSFDIPAKPNRGNAGMGRKKGVPNKITSQVKAMVLAALDGAGGVEYLTRQAEQNPTAFLTLIGKVRPLQVPANHELGKRTFTALRWQRPT